MAERAFPERLTLTQRRKAQRNFLTFAAISSLSYAALAEGVLILFALRLGATDSHIALLASYVHLTMVFVLAGKLLVGRWGAARTYGACWFLRNWAALTLVLAPLVYQRVSPQLGLLALMASSFMFFVLRAMGLSAENVLLNDITGEEDRGRFLGRWQFYSFSAMLAMLVTVSLWLGGTPSFLDFQAVVLVGSVLGMIAALFLFNVPETEGPRRSSREPMLGALQVLYRDRSLRAILLAWGAAMSVVQLLVPFQVLAVKNGYLVSDRGAIAFTVLQMLGLVSGSFMNSYLIDRSGPRPVLIIGVAGLGVLSLFWAFSPDVLNPLYTGGLFYLAGFCWVSVQIALTNYFLNRVGGGRGVLNLSLLILVFQGLCAGLAGVVLGGGMLGALGELGLTGIGLYRRYYLFVAGAAGLALLIVWTLKPMREKALTRVLGMIFSMRDWRALFSVQQLSESPELAQVHRLLEHLRAHPSDVSEQTLVQYLDSPLFTIRTEALEALDRIDFGPAAAKRLIQELWSGEFTTAWMAAEILGRHGVQEAVPDLREGLYSNDFFLEGKCMLSLAQLRDEESYGRIREILRTTYNPRLVIHGARALASLGEREDVGLLLWKLSPRMLPAEQDELLYAVLSLLGWSEEAFRLMTLYNRDHQLGIDALAELAERRMQEREWSGERRGMVAGVLEELTQNGDGAPERLIGLLGLMAGREDVLAPHARTLLREEAVVLREAPLRMRFGVTILGVMGWVG